MLISIECYLKFLSSSFIFLFREEEKENRGAVEGAEGERILVGCLTESPRPSLLFLFLYYFDRYKKVPYCVICTRFTVVYFCICLMCFLLDQLSMSTVHLSTQQKT